MVKLGFGELELFILKAIREQGKATVRDIYEKLPRKGSYTTIMTVMSRLAEKGELLREKEGKQYIYWISSQMTAPAKTMVKRIRDKLFGGRGFSMLSYLLETDEEISEKDLEEIEKLIQKRKKERKPHG